MNSPDHHGNTLVSEFSDDPDMIEIVDLFIEEMPERIAAFEDALARQDFDSLARVAHQLKGSAGGYGFPTITEQAAVIERAAKDHTALDKLSDDVRELIDMCSRARAVAD
jgi:HPt (histidine-containing phosphotransfer) domain-containing protein